MIVKMAGMTRLLVVVAILAGGLGVTAARAADTYELDPVHSFITFKISHLKISTVTGRFNGPTGTVVLDSDAAKSSIHVEVLAKNVDTGVEKRDTHLRSADFFDVEKHPKISFTSTALKATATGYELIGKLSLHGVTKNVTVDLKKNGEGKDPWGGYRVGYETSFTIKRSEFGMNFMPGAVGDDVALSFAFEAVKK